MSTYNSRVHFDGSTELTVETGGEIVIESGGVLDIESGGDLEIDSGATITLAGTANISGAIDIESGADLDIESGGHLDVESGGYIGIASGGWLSAPVVGATSGSSGGSSDAAAIPNYGMSFIFQTASTRKHLDLAAPVAGVRKEIFLSLISSGAGTVIDGGTGITFDSTNRYAYVGSSDLAAADGVAVLQLMGHSTTLWTVLDYRPSTAWKFVSAT